MATKAKLRKRAFAKVVQAEEIASPVGLQHRVFCFRDSKSGSYGPPITYNNREMFIRDMVVPQLQKADSTVAKHPMDFSVFELGSYDPRTGELHLQDKICLGLVSDFAPQA